MVKRETTGTRLKQAREQAGMSVPQLVQRILDDYRKDIGASTIRDIEKNKTPNPGIKTLEFIALGVGLDPLEVMSLSLDAPAELEPGFKASQFARLWEHYSKLNKERRVFIDDYVRTLIEKLARWR